MSDNIKQLPRRPKTFDEYNRERITDEQRINDQNIRLAQLEAKNEALRASKANEQAELLSTLKSLASMASTLQDVKEDVQFVKGVYTRQPDTKKSKQKISDEEKGYAIRAKLLKIPKIKK